MINLYVENYCQNCPDFSPEVEKHYTDDACASTFIRCKDECKCARIYKRLRKEAIIENETRVFKDEIHRLMRESADLRFRMSCEEVLRNFINNERK